MHGPSNGEPAAVLHYSSQAGGLEGTTSAIGSSPLQSQGPEIPILSGSGQRKTLPAQTPHATARRDLARKGEVCGYGTTG